MRPGGGLLSWKKDMVGLGQSSVVDGAGMWVPRNKHGELRRRLSRRVSHQGRALRLTTFNTSCCVKIDEKINGGRSLDAA